MKKTKYEARVGSPFKGEMAQTYGERLEYIASINEGKITPELVIKDAINKNSTFHDYFEWDTTIAANQYRLQQARDLVNHIVEVVVIEGKPSKQRSFFSVKNGDGNRVYVNIKTAIKTPNYRVQLLNQLVTILTNAGELVKLFRSYER